MSSLKLPVGTKITRLSPSGFCIVEIMAVLKTQYRLSNGEKINARLEKVGSDKWSSVSYRRTTDNDIEKLDKITKLDFIKKFDFNKLDDKQIEAILLILKEYKSKGF